LNKSVVKLLFIFSIVSCLCLIGSLPHSAAAGETEDFQFATKLKNDGMFVSAAEEFLRFSERYPHSTFRDEALIGAGEAYMQAGRAVLALDVFEMFLDAYGADEKACKARFYRGRILKALGRYREGAVEFLNVPDESGGCGLVDDSLLEAGECLLSAGESEEAAGVFRRLINQWGDSDLVPRAMYSLALTLLNTGRDLGADKMLRELVNTHPASPVAALALVRLGEWALARGDVEAAEKHFEHVVDRYREKSLQEKGMFNLIEIYGRREDDATLLETAERYLDRFPEATRRGIVFNRAIEAAWRMAKYDRALSMIDESTAEGAVRDSTGSLALLRGKIQARKGRTAEALQALSTFRLSYPRSPHNREGLVLEADLRRESGSPLESARLYHLALLEENSGPDDVSILARLAEVSVRDLADTVSAIRYWEMVVREDKDGEAAEEALWHASRARERIGDPDGARTGYEKLLERFPAGRFSGDVERRIDYLATESRWGKEAAQELARAAVSDAPEAVRLVRTAVILLETVRDPEEAARILERALDTGLSDTLLPEARYYLGKAHALAYEKSRVREGGGAKSLELALSTWWDIARDYAGTTYGMRAHRDYLEYKLNDLGTQAKLKRLDEFSKLYGTGAAGRWAVGEKIDILYGLAQEGEEWAADSARALCETMMRGGGRGPEMKEAVLKYGYLNRIGDDLEAAEQAFGDFVTSYGDDRRVAPVLYDLGETLVRLKRYDDARVAYSRCLSKTPHRSLAEKCALRIGDCLYYEHRFAEAFRTYAGFVTDHPDSKLSIEAAYRQALALEQLGRAGEVDSILTRLAGRQDIDRGLRVRLLQRLGQRLHAAGDSDEARPFVEELVTLERSSGNLRLMGDVLYAEGEYRPAIDAYTGALKFADADTCGILAQRARAFFHVDDFERAGKDLASIVGLCPDHEAIPTVYLEQGNVQAERDRCGEAEATLLALREKYPGTGAAVSALYHLAVCDMKRGGYEPAISKLNALVQAAPQSPIIDKVYFKLGSAHFGAGNLNLAALNYTLAAEAAADPDLKFRALRNVASAYQELEKWNEAARAWRLVTEQFPDGEGIVEIFFNLGFCYGQSGRYDMAYEVYSRIPGVAENEEQEGRGHYWAGICLKNLDRCDEAVRDFLRVPYLRTGGMWGVTAKLEAASCYEKIGERDEAEKIYRAVISSHGEGSDWGRVAREALDRLRGTKENGGGGGGLEEKEGSSNGSDTGSGAGSRGGTSREGGM
jgi:TolA-binding protein